jgi:hypothetical protein
MAFFYRKNPKKFNYIPRYYDPEKEAWEQKKAELGYDAKLSHEEQFRAQMRRSWGVKKEEESKAEQRAKLIRRILLGVFVAFLFYFIFCTPLMTNIVSGLMGK